MEESRYLRLTDKPAVRSIEMWPGIFVDLDANNEPVGIENVNGGDVIDVETLDLGDGPRF